VTSAVPGAAPSVQGGLNRDSASEVERAAFTTKAGQRGVKRRHGVLERIFDVRVCFTENAAHGSE